VIRVGTAGWSYPDWDGVVYPRAKGPSFHPLRQLARMVDCVEINSTFYARPSPEVVEGWNRVLAGLPDFVLTAKVHRDFTHRARGDAHATIERDAQDFLAALQPLRQSERLKALLAQFPHSFHFDPHSVRKLGELHAVLGAVPLVLEVRHASWFTPQALSSVRGLGYSLAYIDLPPAWDHPPERFDPVGPLGYLRLHGRNRANWFDPKSSRDQRYDYLYTPAEIEEVVARAQRIEGEHDETTVITNNHFTGKAVVNALELIARIRARKTPVPAELVHAYPRLRPITRAEGQQELF
jgi:uncharacterized protein YecE (DUF72 family)